MKNRFVLLLALACSVSTAFAAQEGRFMKNPDISGDQIVFTYEGDLWLVSAQGGTASRITSAPGTESYAKFSPDGQTLAFTASYDGQQSVYTMPSTGGTPVRVTYTISGAQCMGWTRDGARIVFRSMMENVVGRDPNLFFVSKNGSAPEHLPIDRGVLLSFSPDGKKMLYTRKGSEEYYWKRYKGGWHTDIWMYDFEKNAFTAISDYVGKNAYPMWISADEMYFVSDRTNGITNLYKENLTTKKIDQVTQFSDVDVMWPSTDGKRIVFMHDGYVNVLDLATGSVRKLDIQIPSDRWTLRERTIDPREFIHSANVANDGKSVVLEARGDIFTAGTGKSTMPANLSQTPGTREMYPQLSPDGKQIAFFSDKTGEYELYLQKKEGGEWTQLTKDLKRTNYHLLWSPDGKKILFGNKDFAIFVLDVASKTLTKIDESHQLKNDEFYWEISDYNWSPDSRWICYSFVQPNRNSQIFLYDTHSGTRTAVTDDFYDNLYPNFDADGTYLYYVSSRNFDIQFDFYEDNHIEPTPQQVMAVQLKAGQAPPFAGEGDSAQQNDADEESVKKADKKSPKSPAEAVEIDLAGIKDRTFPLPVAPGNYFYLKAGKGKVAWCSVPKFTEDEYEEIFTPKGSTKWDLHIFDMKEKKESVMLEKIKDYRVSTNGEHLLIEKENDIYVTSFDKAYASKLSGDRVNLTGMTYKVAPVEEWTQIFNDAWRWYRDFFYDANMHGRDWKAIGDRYRAYVPQLSSRDELNWTLSQMVGELCVSHTYISGGDPTEPSAQTSPVYTGWLGADLTADKQSGFYKIAKIYGPTEYNRSLKAPLVRPDIDVKEGDYLTAIDGVALRVPEDYNKMLQVTQGKKVTITVNAKPSATGGRTYTVEPMRYSISLRYNRWLADNINYVLKASDGKLGYMHINAMGAGGIGEFDKFWRAFRYKEGIIIDVRRNSGGWTEYFLIDKLERTLTSYNCLQGMAPFRYPGSAGDHNYVVVSNEYNGSDGEAFVEDFKANKMGEVVGVPSWGGLVGILNGQTTVDNGRVEQSNNSFYNAEGKWIVENHGADPTILVDNDPASVMAGRDPQLEKAVQTALENIKKHPFTFPARPPYPVK